MDHHLNKSIAAALQSLDQADLRGRVGELGWGGTQCRYAGLGSLQAKDREGGWQHRIKEAQPQREDFRGRFPVF